MISLIVWLVVGGIVGWLETPSVDGHFDRISTEIDPAFGTEDEFRRLCDVADAHGGSIIDDIVPGHTGKGADFRLAEMGFNDGCARRALESRRPVIEEFDQTPEVTLLARCLPIMAGGEVTGGLLLVPLALLLEPRLPPLSVYGEASSLFTRILGRTAAGVVGTAAGLGILASGALKVERQIPFAGDDPRAVGRDPHGAGFVIGKFERDQRAGGVWIERRGRPRHPHPRRERHQQSHGGDRTAQLNQQRLVQDRRIPP